jgi:hypothetical protein
MAVMFVLGVFDEDPAAFQVDTLITLVMFFRLYDGP